MQKKSFAIILEAVIKALIGYTILLFGADLATKQLSEIAVLTEKAFSVSGIMPNNELIAGLAQWFYGKKLSYIMIFGMVIHIFIARFTKFKHIFLTGHHILFMAALITGILSGTALSYYLQIILGSAALALVLSFLPRLTQPLMNCIFPKDQVGLAHFGTFGFVLAGYVAKLVGRNPSDLSAENSRKSGRIRLMSDPNVIILVFMFSFLLFLLIFSGKKFFVFHNWTNHVLIHALKSSLLFTAGMYIIIMGVRMMLQEVLDSFQGIAQRLVPDAIPALDSPVIFPFAPQAAALGFFSSLIGGFIGMFVLLIFKVNVVLPAIIAHFFSGGTTGVLGYAVGGYRGAVAGSFLHGLVISFLPLLLLPVMHQLGYTHTTFSETDFGVVGIFLYHLLKFLSLQ